MSGIWSTELASRLPGTPVRLPGATSPVKDIIHDQPRPGGVSPGDLNKKEKESSSPLCKEMNQYLTELDLLMEL